MTLPYNVLILVGNRPQDRMSLRDTRGQFSRIPYLLTSGLPPREGSRAQHREDLGAAFQSQICLRVPESEHVWNLLGTRRPNNVGSTREHLVVAHGLVGQHMASLTDDQNRLRD